MTEREITVQASDVRKMMDYYQKVVSCHFKSKEANECYERLWNAINEKEE